MSSEEHEEATASIRAEAEEEYETEEETYETGDGPDSDPAPLLTPDEVIETADGQEPEDVGSQFDETAIDVFFGQSNYLAEAAEAYANAIEQYDIQGDAESLAEDWREYAENLREQADREMEALEQERDEVLYTSAAQANFAARMLEQGTETIREAADVLGAEENQPPTDVGVRPADTVMDEFPYGALSRIRNAADRVDPEGNFEHTDEYGGDGRDRRRPDTAGKDRGRDTQETTGGTGNNGGDAAGAGNGGDDPDVLDVDRIDADSIDSDRTMTREAEITDANVDEATVGEVTREDRPWYDPRGWF